MEYRKAYYNHVEKLVKCLPMDDVHFIMALSAQNLLPGDTKNKIEKLSTPAEKASYFLNHVINPALDIDDTSDFEKLLTIMQTCGYNHVQKLASTIKLEIDRKGSNVTDVKINFEGGRDQHKDTSMIASTSRKRQKIDLEDHQGNLVVLNTSLDGCDINLLIKLTGDKKPRGMEVMQKATRTTRPTEPTRPTNSAKLVLKLQASELRNQKLPDILLTNKDFSVLKTHYHTILHLMPGDYESTLGKLQDYISDDQICATLSSSNSTIANKIILDCLISRMKCREDVLQLCELLESIALPKNNLKAVIDEIRLEIHQSSPCLKNRTTNSNQSSNNQESVTTSPIGLNDPLDQILASINLDPNSQVLAALKKNFKRLVFCLPSNCAEKVMGTLPVALQNRLPLNSLTSRNPLDFNIPYTAALMLTTIKSDKEVVNFFETFENLIDDNASKAVIEILRDEMLEILHTSTTPSAPDYNTLSSNEQCATVQQTLSTSSPTLTGSVESTASPQEATLQDLEQQLKYKERCSQAEFKYQKPPPLPHNYIDRCSLVNDIATKLLQGPNDGNTYKATLTITGPGGFGKTTTAKLLCYHPDVKKHFTDGFIFIELGPQPTDPNIKLRAIYKLLANEQCGINVVGQKIYQLTNDCCRNLLVIIDDVWHVEDAEPLVKAFSNCKIVLTTRMNDIEQYIASKESMSIGPMNPNEAITLLTKGVIDSRELLQQHGRLLDELAQDFHLWPILLSLVRGQLCRYVNRYKFSFLEAIQNIKDKLCRQGITAFDLRKSRNFAVKVCIDMTLDLLNKSISDHIKILILYTGIGVSLQRTVLHLLWKVSKGEAQDTVDTLWAYGLIQFNDSTLSFNRTQQSCVMVEVHSVISQYIIESMEFHEALTLVPVLSGVMGSIDNGLELGFMQSCGLGDLSSLTDRDYLKFKLSVIEDLWLPLNLKKFNSFTVFDPYYVIGIIMSVIKSSKKSQNIQQTSQVNNLVELTAKKTLDLIKDCKQILRDAHKLCRRLNQGVQKNLSKKDYDKVIQSVQDYINSYPLSAVVKKAITILKKAIPYCHEVSQLCDQLRLLTPECHRMTTITFPGIKFFIKLHKEGHNLLSSGSDDDIKKACDFYKTNKFDDALESIRKSADKYLESHS